jgi:sugar/nucleoside kinase (ribokinase family)
MSGAKGDAPRVVHTGQVVIDVTMKVGALPAPGAEVFAERFGLQVGGGFNVLHAIRQAGAVAEYWGPVGDGLLGQAARDALDRDGVVFAGPTIRGLDTGICVAVTDDTAERTFLSTRGAESCVPLTAYDDLAMGGHDVLYITGYSLIHHANRAALERLAKSRTPIGTAGDGEGTASGALADGGAVRHAHAVVDTSPMIGDVPVETLETINLLHPIWSANERETRILAERLGLGPDGSDGADRAVASAEGPDDVGDIPGLCAALARRLGSTVISRVGPAGAWWSDGGEARHVPSVAVTPIDTNGAGDAHSGVLCALLAEGADLPDALRLANIAGALSTTVSGPATCPTREEIVAAASTAVTAQ